MAFLFRTGLASRIRRPQLGPDDAARWACVIPIFIFAWQAWSGIDLVTQGQEDQKSALMVKVASTATRER
ncbi:MAG: hypothetical protein GY822_10155 [Deltaproteobacteria bacterium]|nr:hypothetical protein [Deltaproteobacteria bacterium]